MHIMTGIRPSANSSTKHLPNTFQTLPPRFGSDQLTPLPQSPEPDILKKLNSDSKGKSRYRLILGGLIITTFLALTSQWGLKHNTSDNTQPLTILERRPPATDYVELNTIRGKQTLAKIRENMAGDIGKDLNHYPLVTEYAMPRVVAIHTKKTMPFGLGDFQRTVASGFIYRKDGIIVTNHHVIEGKDGIVVTMQNGLELHPIAIASDSNADVAVLRVNPNEIGQLELPTFDLADQVRAGDPIIAIGHPKGMTWSVVNGLISSTEWLLNKHYPGVKTDADIMEGYSGGPLINMSGEVVAMNVGTVPGEQSYGFAVEANALKEIVEKLLGQESNGKGS